MLRIFHPLQWYSVVLSLGDVDTNKLKCEREVLKGGKNVCLCVQYQNVYVCCCLRMCAVQLFPAVLLQYSRQRMMELSQPERS